MNKNQPLWRVWGALVGTLTLALAMSGCSGGDTTGQATSTDTTAPAAGPPPGAGGGMPGMSTAGGGQSLPMGGGAMPGGAAPATGGAQVAAATPKDTTPPPHRPDPFKPWWDATPPPPPVLSLIQPVRLAIPDSGRPEIQPNIEIQEVPNRRVAGILSGDGVYALVEGGPEGPQVVKPGDMLGEYRVASIDDDSVLLRRQVGRQTFTQRVPLTDVGSTTVATFSPPAGGIGGPGVPTRGIPGRGGGGAVGGALEDDR